MEVRDLVAATEVSSNEYYDRGVELYDQAMYTESIAAFEDALDITPKGSPEYERTLSYMCEAHTKLGLAHFHMNSLSCAEDYLTRALGIRNGYADLHYHLGAVYYRQERYAEAEECFRKSLSTNPKFTRALVYLGMAMLRQGREDGLAHVEDASSLGPQFGAVKHRQALRSYREGNTQQFFCIMDQLINNNGDQSKDLLERGQKLIKRHDYREAAKVFLDAVTICPTYADLRHYLGLCYLRQGSLAKAIIHLNKALDINPRFSGARVSMALAYEKSGKRDQAITELVRVLETDPKNAVATRFLSMLQHRK
jgi:tetratricopeptide (TPR) repeat protein